MSTGQDYAAMKAQDYEITLQSRSGNLSGVRLVPDGSVEIAALLPDYPNHHCVISLDGTSARVLRDWLREELA